MEVIWVILASPFVQWQIVMWGGGGANFIEKM